MKTPHSIALGIAALLFLGRAEATPRSEIAPTERTATVAEFVAMAKQSSPRTPDIELTADEAAARTAAAALVAAGGYYEIYNPCPYSRPILRCTVFGLCFCSAW